MPTHRPEWLTHEQYPFQLRTAELPTAPVTYIDEGEGRTLLFVHVGFWSFVFRDVIQDLRSQFRCLTLDLPGFGLSPAADHELDVRELAQVVGEFVDHLDIDDITLIGHDIGGPVSLSAIAERRERITGLVLLNTFAWTPDTLGLRTMLGVMSSRLVTSLDVATNLIPSISATSGGVGRRLDDGGRSAFKGPFADKVVRRRFHTSMRSLLADPSFTDSVEQATHTVLNDLPVLSIFGERNDPFGFQKRLADVFPLHEGLVVERGNHFPMMDDPGFVSDRVVEWHARAALATR